LLRRARVLRLIEAISPNNVLDVGCGPGALLAELHRMGIECHGLETSPDALAIGRELHCDSGVQLHDHPADDWLGKFDLVTAFEVLEHIEQDVAALRQWREWIKPGGHLMISVPAHPTLWNAADIWAGHVRRYSRSSLTEAVAKADLRTEKLECYGFPVSNLLELAGIAFYRRMLKARGHTNPDSEEMKARTAQSGTNRSVHTRFWPVFASWPVAAAYDLISKIQNLTLETNLGNGFILIARKSSR
jgi:SAM-dependent methyltransferase